MGQHALVAPVDLRAFHGAAGRAGAELPAGRVLGLAAPDLVVEVLVVGALAVEAAGAAAGQQGYPDKSDRNLANTASSSAGAATETVR